MRDEATEAALREMTELMFLKPEQRLRTKDGNMDTSISTDNFTNQFLDELQVVISALDLAIESAKDLQPEVKQLILTAQSHACAMAAPARWLLQQALAESTNGKT